MTAADSPAALLEAYQTQLRAHVHEPMPESVRVEWDGPLQRASGFGGQGWILYRDLGGIGGDELDELIARQVQFFAGLGQRFEWKYHGHDLPTDLPERLLAAGFVPEERETVVIAPIEILTAEPVLPYEVSIREVFERDDMERIAVLERTVYGGGEDFGFMGDLAEERRADPEGLRIFVAETGDLAVSAGWLRFPSGTEFGTFWVARRIRTGAAAGSTARSSPTGRGSPPSAAAATSRWTPQTTATRSSSGSASSR